MWCRDSGSGGSNTRTGSRIKGGRRVLGLRRVGRRDPRTRPARSGSRHVRGLEAPRRAPANRDRHSQAGSPAGCRPLRPPLRSPSLRARPLRSSHPRDRPGAHLPRQSQDFSMVRLCRISNPICPVAYVAPRIALTRIWFADSLLAQWFNSQSVRVLSSRAMSLTPSRLG